MALTNLSSGGLLIPRNSRVVFTSGVTVATTSDLYATFIATVATGVQALTKSVTITPPERSQDLQSFLGVDENDFQNQMLESKPPGLTTLTGSFVLDADESFESSLDITPTTVTGGYTRYQLGNAQERETDILVQISGSSGVINLALIDAQITKWGDIKVSGPDSHWEQDITAVCLAKNFYWEYKD